jgi:hypothetical protein
VDRNTDTTAHDQTARIARGVWLATFVVPLILATLLLGVKSAQASSPLPSFTPLAFEDEFEEEDEVEVEVTEEECATAEEEVEEGELSKSEGDEICQEAEDEGRKTASGSNAAPEECLLRSAHARLVADDSPGDVRLTVGYTTYEPTAATIGFSASGGKGSLRLGTANRHLGKSGVIRLTEALAEPKMAKVDAAGRFTVQIHVPGSPGSCRRFETEQLTVKKTAKDLAIWSQRN